MLCVPYLSVTSVRFSFVNILIDKLCRVSPRMTTRNEVKKKDGRKRWMVILTCCVSYTRYYDPFAR